MIAKKSIQLTTSSFNHILDYDESIDFRLNETLWKELSSGDVIEFWEDFSGWDKKPSQKSRRVQVKIKKIISDKTFQDLIKNLPENFKQIGYEASKLEKWWPIDTQMKNGVIGIIVEKI